MKELKFLIVFILSLIVPTGMYGQDRKKRDKEVELPNSVQALEKSIDNNDSYKTAKNYERLAKELEKKGRLSSSENYYDKARRIYKKTKREKDEVRVERLIAKIQEKQNKTQKAIVSYDNLSKKVKSKNSKRLNSNDANRLRNQDNLEVQSDYAQSNIAILEEEEGVSEEEVAEAYIQDAEINASKFESKRAVSSYEKALDYIDDKPKEIKVKNKIAKVYSEEKEYEKALDVNLKLLNEARNSNDNDTQVKQLQLVATSYFDLKKEDQAVKALQESYSLATENGNLAEVKKSLNQLSQYYFQQGKELEKDNLYVDFVANIDSIIARDESLNDDKLFALSEKKILQLEKERALKDELISKKNIFNYFLIAAVVLLLIIFLLLIRAYFSIKSKNKKIALQSLRREMNPHFIFNSLNSVNQFISENKELEANKYLTSYSNLMRDSMTNSNKDFISISNEVELLEKYLQLEHLRFRDKFSYSIDIDEAIDDEMTFIPNMVLQPHLENAIWHGLRYIETDGQLFLNFKLVNQRIVITVEDNGIGITKSKELKTINQRNHESRGMTNTLERIKLLNELYRLDVRVTIEEKEMPNQGTIVAINCSIKDKI